MEIPEDEWIESKDDKQDTKNEVFVFAVFADVFAEEIASDDKKNIENESADENAGTGLAKEGVENKNNDWKNWATDNIPAGSGKVAFENGNVIEIVCAVVCDDESD